MTIASQLTKIQLDTLRTNPQANFALTHTQRCDNCQAILRTCFVALGSNIDQNYDTGPQALVERTKYWLSKWANIKVPQHVRVRIDEPHWSDLYTGKAVPFPAECPNCRTKLLVYATKV